MQLVAVIACAAWAVILLLPWRPWSTRERLAPANRPRSLASVTVLIPARNEADVIQHTLTALAAQGPGLTVIVLDDRSSDDTAARARQTHLPGATLKVLDGEPKPPGWAGKLWALQQAQQHVATPYVLLLDADIALQPGVLVALLEKMEGAGLGLVSVMARLPANGAWERLLVPAYVYFFKMLYPFARVNQTGSRVAAAAGGCVLLRQQALVRAGGFAAIAGELIDDCALAARVKAAGFAIWLGLSEAVASQRGYPRLADFWHMVARSAFTELGYSTVRLMLCTLLMALLFLAPALSVLSLGAAAPWGAAAFALMMLCYLPMVRFYELTALWTATLPVAALLFLAMTWSSAWSYWRGTRALWKNRAYGVAE